MPTPTPLSPAELPLVLLACVAHPRERYRTDLRRRLNVALRGTRPAHPARSLEAFFVRQARRSCTWLSGMLRELAVLVARVAFSGLAGDDRRRMLIAPDDDHLTLGCVVTSELKVTTLARSAMTRHRATRQKEDFRLLPELAGKRLAHWPDASGGITAVCRVEDGLVLELTAPSPWPAAFARLRPPGSRAEVAPAALGFGQRLDGRVIRLIPQTPEATVRFSAWLAAEGGLILEQAEYYSRPRRRIGVRMRDFDGDQASLPVVSAPADRTEPWLTGHLPNVGLALSDTDRITLSGWAYPLEQWLTDSLIKRLL